MSGRRIIRGVRVATPSGIQPASVHLLGGTIAAIAGYDEVPRESIPEELGKSLLMPGLVVGVCEAVSEELAICEGISFTVQVAGGLSEENLHDYLSRRWTGMREQDRPLDELIELCCTAPAVEFGLANKGLLAEGRDADFVIWNPEVPLAKTSEGQLFGQLRSTIVAGRTCAKSKVFLAL